MDKQFLCSKCQRSYKDNSSLRRHVSKLHPGKVHDIAPCLQLRRNRKKPYDFQCKLCKQLFTQISDLKHHERKIHGIAAKSEEHSKCALCTFRCFRNSDLISHVQSEHDLQVQLRYLHFDSFEKFLDWKGSTEERTVSKYVKFCGSKVLANETTKHKFVCHRSGYCMPKGMGKRPPKIQVSNKINGVCPASITVFENTDGKCNVCYVSTHVCHQVDIQNLPFRTEERKKVEVDIPFDTDMGNVRSSVHDQNVNRILTLQMQDLPNIQKKSLNSTSTINEHKVHDKNDFIAINEEEEEIVTHVSLVDHTYFKAAARKNIITLIT